MDGIAKIDLNWVKMGAETPEKLSFEPWKVHLHF